MTRAATARAEGPTDRLEPAAVGTRRWAVLRRAIWRPRRFLGGLFWRVSEDGLFTLAAALAFYFFFALFPFILFALALITLLPGVKGLEEWLLAWAHRVVPGDAYTMLEGVIRGLLQQPRSGVLSLGAVLALWGASAAFGALMQALNVAYGVPERRPWWKVRLIAIALTVGLSSFMILAFALTVSSGPLAAWVSKMLGPLGGIALLLGNWLLALAAVTIVIATIFHVCPDVDLPRRWFSPGSVLFTLGFGATTIGFSHYVTNFGSYDKTYGSLGAVIVLLLWMYLLAFFVLLGGEVNAFLDREADAYLQRVRPQAPEERVERPEAEPGSPPGAPGAAAPPSEAAPPGVPPWAAGRPGQGD